MFSDVVMELSKKRFEVIIDEVKEAKGVTQDIELDADDMKDAGEAASRHSTSEEKGEDFPTDPKVQLMEAVKAVFRSWDNPRANVYRRMNDIPYSWGTAVNVQPMVFGNLNEQFRHRRCLHPRPRHRRKGPVRRIPRSTPRAKTWWPACAPPAPSPSCRRICPRSTSSSQTIANNLENHYRDMQDMEFTIENGKLYMLQTRNGKRTAAAALKIAVDLVDEGMITEEEAVLRVEPKQLDSLLHPSFDAKALKAATAHRPGPGRLPGRCLRPGGLHRRGRQGTWAEQGQQGGPGPPGDLPGGYRRHGGRSGHPHRARRHDLPRGGRGPRHGHLLRLRLRRDQDARRRQVL